VLGLKDMAGLLKPASARILIKALKQEVGLPIHFHTHDTSGAGAATILAACDAGVDAVDAAMDAFSGGTSQPCLGSIVEALKNTDRDTGLDIGAIREISNYWEQVRAQYAAFESGLPAPASEVYLHEMPGGQFTNLKAQARQPWAGGPLARGGADLCRREPDVRRHREGHALVEGRGRHGADDGGAEPDPRAGRRPGRRRGLPGLGRRHAEGQPRPTPGRLAEGILKKVLKGEAPLTDRPGKHLPPVDLEATRAKLAEDLRLGAEEAEGETVDDEDLNGYLMYPKVFMDYRAATGFTARCACCRPAPSSTGWSPATRSPPRSTPARRWKSACKRWARRPMTARSRCSSN
jgi:pyruvate carboxylase